ncbi:4053_t:CDS:2 [Cetraspora pellucida]|uniref:4053_t:CDS:1 n=1 Tax=Cetraspora pellucida TaxID=1433469 RepID=A0A9N9BRI7_9GLOM|nr:4053_t:CDS:2 [Cetraspora pellucida]
MFYYNYENLDTNYYRIPHIINQIYNDIINNNIIKENTDVINNNGIFDILKKQITQEFDDKNKLLDNNYYDKIINDNKEKLNPKYHIIQNIRKKQLEYLNTFDNIIILIETECIIKTLKDKNFIEKQLNDINYPKYLEKKLENKKNNKLNELNKILDNIKKIINVEKISENLKSGEKLYSEIEDDKCLSLANKKELYRLITIRYNYVLEYENIVNDIKKIVDDYDYNKFDTKKIKSYLPNDLKNNLFDLLNNKQKYLLFFNELKNINDYNENLLEKLDNYYKNIIDQLYFGEEHKILEILRLLLYQKTFIFLEYKKNIDEETIIENLIKNNRGSLIYNIKFDNNLDSSQKNILNNLITDKINNSMDKLYDELLLLLDKKTTFSIYKTNIVHLMLQQLKQENLTNRDINTIFTKFLNKELENAIKDFVTKTNTLDSNINKNLEKEKKWKDLILKNKNIILDYDNYKNYFNYNLNNINIDYTQRFVKSKRIKILKMPKQKQIKEDEESVEEEEIEMLTSERIKEIEIWLEKSKNYKKSGVFTRLHNDISILIKGNTHNDNQITQLTQNLNDQTQLRQEYEEIIDGALDSCKEILKNLEINEKIDTLVDGLKIIKAHIIISKFL